MKLYKAKVEKQERHCKKHLHSLESYGDDKHYQGGKAYLYAVFLHVIHLRRLSAGSRRRYTAKEKAYKRIFQTTPERSFYFKKSQHILYYDRLPCHIAEHAHSTHCKPAFLCKVKIRHYVGKFFSSEKQSDCQPAYDHNKEYIKNIFQVLFYFHHLRIFSLSIKRSDHFCPTHIFYSTNAIKHRFTIICKIVNLITT